MRLVCLSDTHNRHRRVQVPDGDLLVHAGDFTIQGTAEETAEFNAWLGTLPHRHKIVIAGNHEFLFEHEPLRARELLTNALYLEDAAAVINGLRIWGSPWQPEFGDLAFNLPRGEWIAAKWKLIPAETDILITHGPVYGHVDVVKGGRHVGCRDLLDAVRRVRPRLHVAGHIHQAYGRSEADGTRFVNAAICNESYEPVNAPIVVEL